MSDHGPGAVMPADIEAPDKIVWGFTFRQIAVLGATLSTCYGLWRLLHNVVPLPLLIVGAVPLAALAFGLGFGRRDGLPMDAWLAHGVTFRLKPRRLATNRPATGRGPAKARPDGLLRLPATGIDTDGAITTPKHTTVLVATGTANLALRTPNEQAGLLDGFGRWLNTLATPAQVTVSTRPMDLVAHADALAVQADDLPSPALRAAAVEHAAFLRRLDQARQPLRRQVLVAVTGRDGLSAARTAADSARALAGLGLPAQVLTGDIAAAVLAAAADPGYPPAFSRRALPGQPIRRKP
ncbi:PrgI family protein [Catellatospora paridis]|uniref:PrgI family protein n=1 Tax=Catellatospora paridis TaxID=1617086 RepID=UPI0012D41DB3|nr:PrgI family protein [Catellatospora paridis]